MLRLLVPWLVRVTVFAAVLTPTETDPKATARGESFAVVPTPLRITFCGLPAPLSVTLSDALRAPVAAGVKVTLIVQLAPAANEFPQV